MPTESDHRHKSHSSDEHRRRKRDKRQRDDDIDSGCQHSAQNRRHGREETKKFRKRERDNDRRGYRQGHKNSGRASESGNYDKYNDSRKRDMNDNDTKSRRTQSRDRRPKKRKKSSSKKRKKSIRNKYVDDDSYYSSDYDKMSNDRKEKRSSKSRQEGNDSKSAKALKSGKSKLFPMGNPFGRTPNSKVDAENDYFSFHLEFSIYLYREEGTCFNDIDTREARTAFARFAKHYNSGMLEECYYDRSFPNEVLEESKTTKHSWSFKTTLSERKGLDDLQKGVRRQTEYNSNRDSKAILDIKNPNSIRSSDVACSMVDSLRPN